MTYSDLARQLLDELAKDADTKQSVKVGSLEFLVKNLCSTYFYETGYNLQPDAMQIAILELLVNYPQLDFQ
jgi:hypothetical protein